MRPRLRPALSSPQIEILSEDLGLPYYAAVGLVDLLWQATAEHAPRGNIGRYSNRWVAKSLRWDGDSDALVRGLAAAGLVGRRLRRRQEPHRCGHQGCREAGRNGHTRLLRQREVPERGQAL
jgi:hypothetical protein